METVVYVDSRQRDTTLYPYGNAYTLFLQSPMRNVTRVDLISAKIPNTMYNINQNSNVLSIDSSTIYLNSGFYSVCSLTQEVNLQLQSNVALSYLDSQGTFIFTGNFYSMNCLTSEFATLVGLSPGVTYTSSPVAKNPVYNSMFTGNYFASSNITNLDVNDYVWLDIAEFRTPLTTDARQLYFQSNTYTTTGNTSARSFALIPLDVPSGGIKSFRASDYQISVVFPSRIDSLDRLTIQWLDRLGKPLNFRGLDVNSFVLRVHTMIVPLQMERPVSLPPPVPYEMEHTNILRGAILALVIGLMMIVLVGRKR